MKAAMYGRVSSEEQIDNFSISAQINAINEYCIKNNIELFGSYIDEGISGTKEDRPEFQRMIKDAEKGLFNVILVHKFDRFARKVEISQRIKSRLKKANVNVISITEPVEDSPIGFFQEGLLELLSEYYIKNLSNEIKKGQKERASQGYHHGAVPYGYRTKNGEAYIIEEEATIVKLIYELYLQGMGYSKIALHLNYSEIKTMTGKNWQHHQVDRILRNPVYCGYIYLAGQTYESKMPTIIDKETFDAAQRERGVKGDRYTYRTNRQNEFLLLGLLKCGECGSAMRIASTAKKETGYIYTSYKCNMAARYHMQHKCTYGKHFLAKKLHQKVTQYLNEVASGKIRELKTNQKVSIVDIIDNRKNKIMQELERAKAAYIAGVFSLEEYSQLRTKLEKELSQMKDSLSTPEDNIKLRIDKINTTMEQFNSIPEENIIERKKLLKDIIEYITIGKSGMYVYFSDML